MQQSGTSTATSPDKETDSESDDDSEKQGFVSASQYDPNPVSSFGNYRRLPLTCPDTEDAEKGSSCLIASPPNTEIQADQAKADKLASLKKWHHFDASMRESFDSIADTTLHGLVWSDWDQAKFGEAMVADAKGAVELSIDDFDGIESDDDGDQGYDAEGDPISKKRKKPTLSKSNKSQRARLSVLHDEGMLKTRKHDLRQIAEAGGGGRVLYVFEKVKSAKM